MMASSTKGKAVRSMKHTLTKIKSLLAAIVLLIMALTVPSALAASGAAVYTAADQFTSRDLIQEADLTDAVTFTVSDGTDLTVTEAGVYVLTGTASEVTVTVEAPDDAKVQLVLDGLQLTNSDFPCIYVKTADKVFVTLASDSSLAVTGSFRADGSTNTDGVIFSRQDLVLGGTAVLTVSSTDNGVVCKDDLKITGGTWRITAATKAFEAHNSIRVAGGTFELKAGTDGFHAEDSDDNTAGYIYIADGDITAACGDDAIHATTVCQIDGGTLNLSGAEGIEATYIRINGGSVNITASDDGINAAKKSTACEIAVEFNGGEVAITMGGGDTDGVDSNGNIYMNGGTVTVNGASFDYDGSAQYNGGSIFVNGQQLASIPNQMMGGGMRGGWGGFGNAGGQGAWGNAGGQNTQGGHGGGRGNRGGW